MGYTKDIVLDVNYSERENTLRKITKKKIVKIILLFMLIFSIMDTVLIIQFINLLATL